MRELNNTDMDLASGGGTIARNGLALEYQALVANMISDDPYCPSSPPLPPPTLLH